MILATSPLLTLRFRLVFAAVFFSWAVLQTFLLHWYGFNWRVAIMDSLVSNLLLAAASVLIIFILQFYIPQKNRYAYLLALCSVLALLWLVISRALLAVTGNVAQDFFEASQPVRFAFGFLVTGCIALISVLWYTLQEQSASESRRAEAEKLSRDAELFRLRQQLQPHFLFNSLNSINALIQSRPEQARNMVQQLSDFLRGTLKKDEQQWSSLQDELQHLQLYLEIEKVRFGHRLSTVVDYQPGTENMKLPSLLLQPVVENAIKFGLYDTIGEITIRIEAAADEGRLRVRVSNPFDPETSSPKKGTGFGLNSVQRRLYLLFARNDLLHTSADADLFITTIIIPQA